MSHPITRLLSEACGAPAALHQTNSREAPYLIELVTEHILKPGYSFADEFDFGLDLILDALEQRLDS